uniref:E2F/DP family winged-helix DNA-binding domain-containing protein n=2 Tax=Eptatretus burgeri TaxID=7764 RepID=A0A8C4R957_EPTBU
MKFMKRHDWENASVSRSRRALAMAQYAQITSAGKQILAATPSRCSHAQSVQPRPVGAATPSREMPARKMTSPPAVSPLREGIPAVAHWSQVSVTDDFQTYSQQQSRKDKSLGLLSLRFLRNLPSPSDAATGRQIYVDNMASVLGVERRRIYDVVNVLESLALLSRVAKNRYCWHGPEAMKQALKQLGAPEEESNPSSCSSSDSSEEPHPMHAETGSRLSNRFPHILRGGRKEKSLRTLSQRFVMLFLTSSTKDIDLDTAASSIINHYSPCGPEDEKAIQNHSTPTVRHCQHTQQPRPIAEDSYRQWWSASADFRMGRPEWPY